MSWSSTGRLRNVLSPYLWRALFQDAQFRRAIHDGAISILNEKLKNSILETYAAITSANQCIVAYVNQDVKMQYQGTAEENARNSNEVAVKLIDQALSELVSFLGSE